METHEFEDEMQRLRDRDALLTKWAKDYEQQRDEALAEVERLKGVQLKTQQSRNHWLNKANDRQAEIEQLNEIIGKRDREIESARAAAPGRTEQARGTRGAEHALLNLLSLVFGVVLAMFAAGLVPADWPVRAQIFVALMVFYLADGLSRDALKRWVEDRP